MFRLTVMITIVILMLAGTSVAQSSGKAAKQAAKQEIRKRKRTRPASDEEPLTKIALYLTGEARITIKGDQNPPVKIGMAPSGVTIIEFPANDKFFAVHPPRNGDWVEVEKSPSMKSDTHLVLRAGKDLSAQNGPAMLTVQMRSGLALTFWIYPVKYIAHQAHRVVVTYEREEIIAARRSAGLAVNLGESEEGETAPKITNTDAAKPSVTAQSAPPIPVPASRSEGEKAATPDSADAPRPAAEPPAPARGDHRVKAVRKLLGDAVADAKRFKKWTDATNGLSVSTRLAELDDATRVYLVAVKNVENETLRLLPGHPDLVIESLDNKGKVIQLAPIKKLHVESTTANNVIPARATIYFAVAYKPPILGKQQRVRVTVGQINAADDPVIAGATTKQ
jgi:hypothetical protein